MRNICIVSPSLKMGGIERALSVLANYFVSQGHTVSFISAQGGEKFYTLDSKIIFLEPKLNRQKGVFGKISFYFSVVNFIRKTVKKQKPEVVLSFGDAFNPLVLLALLGTKFPVYISDRTSPDFPFNPIIRLGKKWLYPKSSGFIAQTQKAADYKKLHFKDRLNIKIIPNALKETKVYDVPKLNQVVCVGRLSIEKGQDRLIDAFSKIANDVDWKLVLAGDGPMRGTWEKKVADLKLKDKIIFLGKVQNVDLLLKESSIFVLPSRLEGFPNALCEAMAVGLPCVCFDSIATDYFLIPNQNGLIIKENDIDVLATTIKKLIENPELREDLGNNAKQIAQKLAVATIGEEFLNFMFLKK